MKNFKEKIFSSFTDGWLKVVLGLFICLLSIFGALSNAPSTDWLIYVSKFLTWCISYLFGALFAYAIYFLVFLIGLSMVFSTKKIKVTLDMTIYGVALIILGCIILISNSQTLDGTTYLTFENFAEVYDNNILAEFPNVIVFKNCGVIGLILVAIINSGMTYIGSNVIGSLFLVAGIFFTFAKSAIKFTKIIINYYRVTFDKKVPAGESYTIAKDLNYDTTAINAIKANKKIDEELEKNAKSSPQVNDAKAENAKKEEEKVISKPQVNESAPKKQEYVSKRFIVDPQSEHLRKATFDENETFEAQNVEYVELQDVEEVRQKEQENIVTSEYSNRYNGPSSEVEQEEVKVEQPSENQNKSYSRISDLFTIPQKKTSETTKPETKVNVTTPTREVRKPVDEEPEENETSYSNKFEVKKKKTPKFVYPKGDLLTDRDETEGLDANRRVCEDRKEKINQIFDDLGVGAKIVSYTIGPSVSQFDLQTDKNVSISTLSKYIDDISVRLGGLSTRFERVVIGKTTSGIEIPNEKRSTVNFKSCFEQLERNKASEFTVPFGLNINGDLVSADLRDFPHLLVCGTTGSGKSIFVHSLIMTLIMRNTPSNLKLILIDPKRVEFGKYKEIPHLLCPPITDSNKAFNALNKLVNVMEQRYGLFEEAGVSNIKQYNQEALENGRDKLPYIVLVCDEFADLMDTNKKCAEPVVRIGQKARAAGIHMIIATQRPSTNVITGVIKANLPTRVALSTSSYVDSITILDQGGAEKLLGNGDMLIMCPLINKQGFTRVQGSFVDNKEIKQVCDFLRDHGEVEYDPLFLDLEERSRSPYDPADQEDRMNRAADDKYEEVKQWVKGEEFTSISKIQRTFGFGFPRAGKIFSLLEQDGIIAKENEPNNAKGRRVLIHVPDEVVTQSENPGTSEVSTMDYSKRGDY